MQNHRKMLTIQHGRYVRYSSTTTTQGSRAPVPRWPLRNYARTRMERFLLWLRGQPVQHYGPKAPIPELFQRRDMPFFALDSGALRMRVSPPMFHHNLVDAAAGVGALEERLGYIFKDKMLCVQALKVTAAHSPLYFDGTVHELGANNRLALLGDRLLSLVVCEKWFQTERTTNEYSQMSAATVSRVALARKGRDLRLHRRILVQSTLATEDHIAETIEAVIGAIYVDSGSTFSIVKDVIKRMRIDDHPFLRADREHYKSSSVETPSRVADQHTREWGSLKNSAVTKVKGQITPDRSQLHDPTSTSNVNVSKIESDSPKAEMVVDASRQIVDGGNGLMSYFNRWGARHIYNGSPDPVADGVTEGQLVGQDPSSEVRKPPTIPEQAPTAALVEEAPSTTLKHEGEGTNKDTLRRSRQRVRAKAMEMAKSKHADLKKKGLKSNLDTIFKKLWLAEVKKLDQNALDTHETAVTPQNNADEVALARGSAEQKADARTEEKETVHNRNKETEAKSTMRNSQLQPQPQPSSKEAQQEILLSSSKVTKSTAVAANTASRTLLVQVGSSALARKDASAEPQKDTSAPLQKDTSAPAKKVIPTPPPQTSKSNPKEHAPALNGKARKTVIYMAASVRPSSDTTSKTATKPLGSPDTEDFPSVGDLEHDLQQSHKSAWFSSKAAEKKRPQTAGVVQQLSADEVEGLSSTGDDGQVQAQYKQPAMDAHTETRFPESEVDLFMDALLRRHVQKADESANSEISKPQWSADANDVVNRLERHDTQAATQSQRPKPKRILTTVDERRRKIHGELKKADHIVACMRGSIRARMKATTKLAATVVVTKDGEKPKASSFVEYGEMSLHFNETKLAAQRQAWTVIVEHTQEQIRSRLTADLRAAERAETTTVGDNVNSAEMEIAGDSVEPAEVRATGDSIGLAEVNTTEGSVESTEVNTTEASDEIAEVKTPENSVESAKVETIGDNVEPADTGAAEPLGSFRNWRQRQQHRVLGSDMPNEDIAAAADFSMSAPIEPHRSSTTLSTLSENHSLTVNGESDMSESGRRVDTAQLDPEHAPLAAQQTAAECEEITGVEPSPSIDAVRSEFGLSRLAVNNANCAARVIFLRDNVDDVSLQQAIYRKAYQLVAFHKNQRMEGDRRLVLTLEHVLSEDATVAGDVKIGAATEQTPLIRKIVQKADVLDLLELLAPHQASEIKLQPQQGEDILLGITEESNEPSDTIDAATSTGHQPEVDARGAQRHEPRGYRSLSVESLAEEDTTAAANQGDPSESSGTPLLSQSAADQAPPSDAVPPEAPISSSSPEAAHVTQAFRALYEGKSEDRPPGPG